MPYTYLTQTGVIVPDTSTLKSDVQTEYVQQFGPSLLLEDDTPQGRLIDVEVTARDGVVRITAESANQINPNISSGVFLKDICALHGIEATGAKATVLPGCLLEGRPLTFIPSGSRIADTAGNYYRLVEQVTLGADGKATASFQAVDTGPLNPDISSVTRIIDGVFGWLTVTNPQAATVGTQEMSDADLRLARVSLLSKMAKGPTAAIVANVLAQTNVRWLTVRDNFLSTQQVIDGVTLPASATWICVQGGVDEDIALAILGSKQTGSPLSTGVDNGTVVELQVVDPISGQTYPSIFTRPNAIKISMRVTVGKGSSIDPNTAVPDAVMRYANGQLAGERGFVVGAPISPFETAAAINVQLPELFIRKVELALWDPVDPAYAVQEIPITLWQNADISAGDVRVVIQ